mgnify:CR=1 FL=1
MKRIPKIIHKYLVDHSHKWDCYISDLRLLPLDIQKKADKDLMFILIFNPIVLLVLSILDYIITSNGFNILELFGSIFMVMLIGTIIFVIAMFFGIAVRSLKLRNFLLAMLIFSFTIPLLVVTFLILPLYYKILFVILATFEIFYSNKTILTMKLPKKTNEPPTSIQIGRFIKKHKIRHSNLR